MASAFPSSSSASASHPEMGPQIITRSIPPSSGRADRFFCAECWHQTPRKLHAHTSDSALQCPGCDTPWNSVSLVHARPAKKKGKKGKTWIAISYQTARTTTSANASLHQQQQSPRVWADLVRGADDTSTDNSSVDASSDAGSLLDEGSLSPAEDEEHTPSEPRSPTFPISPPQQPAGDTTSHQATQSVSPPLSAAAEPEVAPWRAPMCTLEGSWTPWQTKRVVQPISDLMPSAEGLRQLTINQQRLQQQAQWLRQQQQQLEQQLTQQRQLEQQLTQQQQQYFLQQQIMQREMFQMQPYAMQPYSASVAVH